MKHIYRKKFTKLACGLGFALFSSLPIYSQDNSQLKYNEAREEFEKFEQEHGGFIETRNTRMHYLMWGNPEDLPLVWIHGSFTNAYEIKDLAEEIVNQGYYLIAIDYYGHGQTPIPEHDVSLYHVADDLAELMDSKHIEKAIIGGWSRGGYIASAFYDSYPDRVLGLILEDGGSVGTNSFYHSLDRDELSIYVDKIFEDRIEYKKYESEFEVYLEYHDKDEKETQFELLAWISQDKEDNWSIGSGLEELFNLKTSEQFFDNILRPMKSPLFARSMALMDPSIIFRNLDVPILILDPIDENDLFPFENENRKLKNSHPKLITHEIYENTGHNIHYEKPEKFLADVLMFLKTFRK